MVEMSATIRWLVEIGLRAKGELTRDLGSLRGPRFQRVRTAHCAAPLVHDSSANFADNFVIDWS